MSTAGEPAKGVGVGGEPALSADGRFVAFTSSASNLVPGDTNYDEELGGIQDVFVRDRALSTTTRVSVATDGSQGDDGLSVGPSISADGRYIAFWSGASTLVPRDTNLWPDIFVHDLEQHLTTRVSLRSDGRQANRGAEHDAVISADGRFVAFASSSTNLVPGYGRQYRGPEITVPLARIFLHDRRTGRTAAVSPRAGRDAFDSYPSISSDGRFVAYQRHYYERSESAVFVRDRVARRTMRVDVSSTERAGNGSGSIPAISANGRRVAFESMATNLVPGDGNGGMDIFVRDLRRGSTTRASIPPSGEPFRRCPRGSEDGVFSLRACGQMPAISASGRFVVFSSAGRRYNGRDDAFYLRDLRLKVTARVARDEGGLRAAVSGDGQYVAFPLFDWAFGGEEGLFVRGPMWQIK